MSFPARYHGTCARNRDTIFPGDTIEYDTNHRLVHVECDEETDRRADDEAAQLDRDATRPVCPHCHLLQPCGCDD